MGSTFKHDQHHWYREPYVWLLIAIPLSSVLVGMTMLVLATRSDDGLVADDYYRRGLQINQDLARDRIAGQLGLNARLSFDSGTLRLQLHAADPSFQFPAQLRLRFSHATRKGRDVQLVLNARAEAAYDAPAPKLSAGRWYLEVAAADWRLTSALSVPTTRAMLEAPKL